MKRIVNTYKLSNNDSYIILCALTSYKERVHKDNSMHNDIDELIKIFKRA